MRTLCHLLQMRLLLCLLCSAAAASAEPVTYSLSVGAGNSHALAGVRLEAAGEHWGAFAAASFTNFFGDPGLAAGVRWTASDRQGLVLSLHADLNQDRSMANHRTLTVFAATIGYRVRRGRFWFEAAVGPAFFIDSHYAEGIITEQFVHLERQVGFGALGGQDNPPIPDLELAIGFEL
jgi:hypothetical protein